jgi:DNA-binding beta-propeller fold protein YncE
MFVALRGITAILVLAVLLVIDAGVSQATPGDLIFSDGFESGGTGAWSSVIGELPPVFPSKGGTIAVNRRGDTLAVANRATDDVTLFSLPLLVERARVSVGDEPASLTWAADDTLYVVNRNAGSVTAISDAHTSIPIPAAPIAVGSEPGWAALSPSGDTLYVSVMADGALEVIDTATTSSQTIDLGGRSAARSPTSTWRAR